MKRTPALIVIATLAAFGQRIEIQKSDRNKITRLGTAQNHLSVIELNEPVTQVAAGSSSFKIEWRENKVFIQPLEPLDRLGPTELRAGAGGIGRADALRDRPGTEPR
ncbi:MAG: hypothetical protein IPP47_17160 [Bryobacterales bacterium]|nr:hypothetical protein [Bryobacterales bacterium]